MKKTFEMKNLNPKKFSIFDIIHLITKNTLLITNSSNNIFCFFGHFVKKQRDNCQTTLSNVMSLFKTFTSAQQDMKNLIY